MRDNYKKYFYKMNLYTDIEKATYIPSTDENIRFTQLTEPSQAEEDKRMNQRTFKPPRNLNLLESETLQDYDNVINHRFLNEPEITSSIKTVNGGIDYSNEFIECFWEKRQSDAKSSLEGSSNTSPETSMFSSENKIANPPIQRDEKLNNQDNRLHRDTDQVLKLSRICKNAAFVGLVKNNIVSIRDLQLPNTSVSTCTEYQISQETPDGNATNNNVHKSKTYNLGLVQSANDPDIFTSPFLHAEAIDESQLTSLQFIITVN
ncbi:hypothetical protein KM043_015873 [Ampulex compressa]|nr:hypothetical protein KM043_015873 [Ampulex compressa]